MAANRQAADAAGVGVGRQRLGDTVAMNDTHRSPALPAPKAATRLALTTFCLAGLVACSSAPLQPIPVARGDMAGVQTQLQAFIDHEMRVHKLTGLSIALVDDQTLLWAHGAGWADVQAKVAAGPDTLYRMGSVSKLLTDTAAMQLVAQQRLALDAPIVQALPDFRIQSRFGEAPITARQLMTHHSGLPRDMLGGMWGTPVGDFRAMVDALGTEHTAAPPGLSFAYSNVGLDLLGVAIERLAGTPFETRMQQTVLAPLGMDGASFSAAPVASPRMARGHLQRAPQEEPALRDVPAGGLNASVADMAKFIAMQFARGRNARGEVVLPEPQWAEMLRVQNADVPLDAGFGIGLGWMFTTLGGDTVRGGGPVAHHAGATFFFRSQLMVLPEQRLGVVVAANDGAAGPSVNRIAQRALALLLEAKTGLAQPPRVPGFRPARTPWSDAEVQACVGDYITLAGVASVRRDGNGLRAELDGRTLELRQGEDGALGLRYRLGGLIPVSLGVLSDLGLHCWQIAGRDVLVAQLDGQSMLVGDRLPPPQATLPPWQQALAGRYEPELLPGERHTIAHVDVEAADGRLWVRPRLVEAFGDDDGRLPLQVLSPTQAVLVGPLAGTGPMISIQPSADGRARFAHAGSTYVRSTPR
jgi:CubicO group peptidase (beta-lactamase class C family)